jgi:hypothetical protein
MKVEEAQLLSKQRRDFEIAPACAQRACILTFRRVGAPERVNHTILKLVLLTALCKVRVLAVGNLWRARVDHAAAGRCKGTRVRGCVRCAGVSE